MEKQRRVILLFLSALALSCSFSDKKPSIAEFHTTELRENYDGLAPDGSEIRLLNRLAAGSMVHCTLPANETSTAVRHKTVEDIWYFMEGEGQVWRKVGDREEVTDVKPGISLTIPLGTHFQFRNDSTNPLRFVIVTMPPWPGKDEAVKVQGRW